MTLDDGIIKIYALVNAAADGEKPDLQLSAAFTQHHFGYETVGFRRYYTAMEAKQRVDDVVRIHQDRDIRSDQNVAELEDGTQFKIVLVQHMMDEDGLRITKLTLERINADEYIKQAG